MLYRANLAIAEPFSGENASTPNDTKTASSPDDAKQQRPSVSDLKIVTTPVPTSPQEADAPDITADITTDTTTDTTADTTTDKSEREQTNNLLMGLAPSDGGGLGLGSVTVTMVDTEQEARVHHLSKQNDELEQNLAGFKTANAQLTVREWE